jgi:hypothetical protein
VSTLRNSPPLQVFGDALQLAGTKPMGLYAIRKIAFAIFRHRHYSDIYRQMREPHFLSSARKSAVFSFISPPSIRI